MKKDVEKKQTNKYLVMYRKSRRKGKKESRRVPEQARSYAPVIQHLRKRFQVLSQVERNLFEAETGDLYYVKVWGKPLPSFFGLSERKLREYGSPRLHLIFYHASRDFYVDLPFELLSARLDKLSYQLSAGQYKVHFNERSGNLILEELNLTVTPYRI